MSVNYNQRLHALIGAHALVECVIPVIVCDENFRVCMISQGARSAMRPLSIGKDMSNMFSDDERDTLRSLVGATLAEPTLGGSKTPVIAVGGTVHGERYLAIIIEPQAIFMKMPEPWYVDKALDAVTNALSRLITSERVGVKHLEWSCAMLARLTEFSKRQQERGLYSAVSSSDIYTELDIVLEESARALTVIGAGIRYNKDMRQPFSTNAQPLHVYLISTTLICALALVSSDGVITADCRLGADGEFLNISLATSPDLPDAAPPKCFDDLVSYVPHLYLELAAVRDLASALGILLECDSSDGTLTLRVRIPADTSGAVKFRSADIVDADTVRERLTSLCEYIRYTELF